ncbi:hypothetical protein RB213_005482 [Colletotrichum asianum]
MGAMPWRARKVSHALAASPISNDRGNVVRMGNARSTFRPMRQTMWLAKIASRLARDEALCRQCSNQT